MAIVNMLPGGGISNDFSPVPFSIEVAKDSDYDLSVANILYASTYVDSSYIDWGIYVGGTNKGQSVGSRKCYMYLGTITKSRFEIGKELKFYLVPNLDFHTTDTSNGLCASSKTGTYDLIPANTNFKKGERAYTVILKLVQGTGTSTWIRVSLYDKSGTQLKDANISQSSTCELWIYNFSKINF